MRLRKLFVQALMGCALVGTSGAAMAACDDDGNLIFQTFPDGLVLDGEDCILSDVLVIGDLIVKNSDGIPRVQVLIRNSKVDGNIVMKDIETAQVMGTEVSNGDILIRRVERVALGDNVLRTTGAGQGGPVVGQQRILVREGDEAATNGTVFNNEVLQGVIECKPLDDAVGDVFAKGNVALDVACKGQVFE